MFERVPGSRNVTYGRVMYAWSDAGVNEVGVWTLGRGTRRAR